MNNKLILDNHTTKTSDYSFDTNVDKNNIHFMVNNHTALKLNEIMVSSGYDVSIVIMEKNTNEVLNTITMGEGIGIKGFEIIDKDKQKELHKNNPTLKQAWDDYQKSKEVYSNLMVLQEGQ